MRAGWAIGLVLLTRAALWAYQYDALLLKAQAKIYPKLLMLEEKMTPARKKPVRLLIVARREEIDTARELAAAIRSIYHDRINGIPFRVEATTFEKLPNAGGFDGLYLLKTDPKALRRAIRLADAKGAPTFVYDYRDLDEGALIALVIKAAPLIYFNKTALGPKGPSFIDNFYTLVRFIHAHRP